jgi:aromatic-L-amino-acid decarboxylase
MRVWRDIDAAYDGSFALTERGRERLRGTELADSVTVDAHKGLFVPYGVGALVVRDPGRLVDAHEGQGAYQRDIETVADLPHYFQRGRADPPEPRTIGVVPLQLHGTDAFAAELDRMLDLAKHAQRSVGRDGRDFWWDLDLRLRLSPSARSWATRQVTESWPRFMRWGASRSRPPRSTVAPPFGSPP